MNSSVILVTAPDDTHLDGPRVLLVDLTPAQTKFISDSLTELDYTGRIVLYVWNSGDSIEWLIDKKQKSDSIIFNADSGNDLITGYIAAQCNSYYFGILKSIGLVNNSAIYSLEQCKTIFENIL